MFSLELSPIPSPCTASKPYDCPDVALAVYVAKLQRRGSKDSLSLEAKMAFTSPTRLGEIGILVFACALHVRVGPLAPLTLSLCSVLNSGDLRYITTAMTGIYHV
eukprot:Protomagalhaensia_sp_Gyna_25__3074@NODE_2824_length_871_cov_81_234375_g2357_i0_p2_GENE_NODE_2824_length_871_cov_81_234375_g2357_i0NODE_2824_length_871_cov_81_234375_g2357_i0_p2_ORF_typecomplete_len105_score2_53_NODE_2824_length_871_cov_81_234375_g2357_i056370